MYELRDSFFIRHPNNCQKVIHKFLESMFFLLHSKRDDMLKFVLKVNIWIYRKYSVKEK